MLSRALRAVLVGALLLTACSRGEAATGPPTTPESPGSLSVVASRSPAPEAEPEPDENAPNIVVFMTDDQTVGETVALEKVRSRLFDQGMTFTQSFVNLPSCCPSRATFLTGQHAVNHGVLSNQGVNGGFAAFDGQDATLPVALQDVGYHTILLGKYLNGFGFIAADRYTPPGWDDFRGLVSPTEVLYHSPTFWDNGRVVSYTDDDYVTDVLTDMAVDAIDTGTASDRPLFAWINYPAPHAQAGGPFGITLSELGERAEGIDQFMRPAIPAAEHAGRFAGTPLPASEALNEADISDKPAFLERATRRGKQLEKATAFNQAALESLLSVDESVAAIMDEIAAKSPDRPTWFMFTSDNGLLLGQHRHFGVKYFPYEEAVRVPLGIMGPGVEPGGVSSQVVSNIDLAPTILDIAGAEPLREPDGSSLVPLLLGEAAPRGRAVLIQGFEFRNGSPPYKAVHTGAAVYVEWLTGERELYDLVADPEQLVNVVDDPEAADLLNEMVLLLRELEHCAGAECGVIGADLDVPAPPPATAP